MPVPNEVDVSYPDQSEIDTGDIIIWEKVGAGYWVVSGGLVTAQGTPDGTVAVSAGTARVGGSNKTITAGNVSVLTGSANPDGSVADLSDSTDARFSLIVLNGASELGVLHGDPAGLSPNNDGSYLCVFPSATNYIVLAAVFIPPGAAAVTNSMISSKRIVGSTDAFHDQIHSTVGTNHTGLGAKGSLLVGTAAGTNAALVVGSNGQSLIADSTTTSGLAWRSRRLGGLTAIGSPITTTETVMLSGTIPANTLAAGDAIRVRAFGRGTTGVTPGNATFNLRVGPTTLTGALATTAVITMVASRTDKAWMLEGVTQIFTIGASGTMVTSVFVDGRLTTGDLFIVTSGGVPFFGSSAAVAIDTTVQNLIELTFVSSQAGSSATIYNGVIERI